ncbi:MmpS family transport accessory protein [Nocardia thailandica]
MSYQSGYPQHQGAQQPGGYPAQGGYPQPPGKKKVWPWVLGGVALVFVLIVGGCVAVVGVAANEIDKEANREVTVSYEVTGTGTGSVFFSGRNFDVAQETDVTLPWSKTVTMDGLVKIVSLTATGGEEDGEIGCRITVGGKVIAEQTANGPYASANCTGDAGK